MVACRRLYQWTFYALPWRDVHVVNFTSLVSSDVHGFAGANTSRAGISSQPRIPFNSVPIRLLLRLHCHCCLFYFFKSFFLPVRQNGRNSSPDFNVGHTILAIAHVLLARSPCAVPPPKQANDNNNSRRQSNHQAHNGNDCFRSKSGHPSICETLSILAMKTEALI